MTYTEHRVLIEELQEIRNALDKADFFTKEYMLDSQANSRDRRLALALYPNLDNLLALVEDRLADLYRLEALPE